MLYENHRQGDDKVYADLLNRAREDLLTDDDIELLETRVFLRQHPDIPKHALIVTCLNKRVNEMNEEKLSLIEAEEISFDAIIISETQKTINPILDSSNAIRNTPLQKNLKLKIGAKIMLTYNVDTIDCLTNGAFGEVIGFQ